MFTPWHRAILEQIFVQKRGVSLQSLRMFQNICSSVSDLALSCCESHFKVLFQFGDFGAFSMLLCLSIQFLLPKILRSLKLTTTCTWKKIKASKSKRLNMYHFSFHLSCASNLSIVDRQCLSGLCQSLDFCP